MCGQQATKPVGQGIIRSVLLAKALHPQAGRIWHFADDALPGRHRVAGGQDVDLMPSAGQAVGQALDG